MDSIAKLHLVLILSVVASIVGFGIAVFSESDDSSATADPSTGTKVGDLYYTFDGNDASIVGYSSSIDWTAFNDFPDTVSYNGNTYTITFVGYRAFKNCTNLNVASLPANLTYLGYESFFGCTSLSLTELPATLPEIGENAFENCTSLALTSLPSGVVLIKPYAFFRCTSLTLTSLPDGLDTIRDYAFKGCTSLALTSLPDGVKVGRGAFDGCTNLALTSISLGTSRADGNLVIQVDTFKDCPNITISDLPSNLIEVGSGAFSGCSGITTLVIRSSPTVANDSFAGTSSNLQILNLSGVPDDEVSVRPGNAGIASTATIRSGIEGVSMLQQIDGGTYDETIVVKKDGAEFTVMAIIPIFVLLAILLYVARSMREGEDYYGCPIGESDGGADKGTENNDNDNESE